MKQTGFDKSRWLLRLAMVGILIASLSGWLYNEHAHVSAAVELTPALADNPGVALSPEEAFGKSDLIVVGRVIDAGGVRTVGPEGELGVDFGQTVIEVVSTLKGSSDPGLQLVLETEALFDPAGALWKTPGTEVLAFLWLKRDQESAGKFYRLINPEALFIVSDEKVVPVFVGDIGETIAELTLPEILETASKG